MTLSNTEQTWSVQPFDFLCDKCSRTINRKQSGKLRKVKKLRTVTTTTTPATTTTTTDTTVGTVVVTTTPATVTTTVKTLILKKKKKRRRVLAKSTKIVSLKQQSFQPIPHTANSWMSLRVGDKTQRQPKRMIKRLEPLV